MHRIQSLCVYCGSSAGRGDEFVGAARTFGDALVARGIRLVYGGARVGVMGAIAERVLALGGEVVGVIPEALMMKEVAHAGLKTLHVTPSMHERKMLMAELADGFVALPGGIGTMEEIFEVWTWAQLGFHKKPCGLLNTAGYYDALIAFLDRSVTEEFVKPPHRAMLVVEREPEALLNRFMHYEAPTVAKWIGKTET